MEICWQGLLYTESLTDGKARLPVANIVPHPPMGFVGQGRPFTGRRSGASPIAGRGRGKYRRRCALA